MKWWQYVILLTLGFIFLMAIMYLIPSTSHLVKGFLNVLKWIWIGIAGLLVMIVVLVLSGGLGFVFKSYGIAFLDSKISSHESITTGMHWGIAVVSGLITGVIQTIIMPVLMNWETWMRWLAMEMGWGGFYETFPIFWLFYALIVFTTTYMLCPDLINPPPQRSRW